jgi:hypothetical protein
MQAFAASSRTVPSCASEQYHCAKSLPYSERSVPTRVSDRFSPDLALGRSGCRRGVRIRDPCPALRAKKDGSAKQSAELFRQALRQRSKTSPI